MRPLPLFVTKENHLVMGALLFIAAVALYLPANHLHLFEPQYLPMTWMDRAIPFLPGTVWIYLSEYLFFIAVYLSARDIVNLNKYFYSFIGLQTTSVLIFWLWPTTYPRHLYPLPENINSLTYYFFNRLRMTDTPANCAPSLHVSSVYLSAFIFLDDTKRKFPFFFIWGTLVAISTLTTKQHYIVDVISGFLMAVVVYVIFHKYITYARPKRASARKA